MKLIIAIAAAGIVSSLTVITPANAQKDPACILPPHALNSKSGCRSVCIC